jgi:hypothetical protein
MLAAKFDIFGARTRHSAAPVAAPYEYLWLTYIKAARRDGAQAARMDPETDRLLSDLKRYRFLLQNFPRDERLTRALLGLVAETEERLRALDVAVPRTSF